MNKLLTISIAGYNVEKYIRNTLDSLLIDEIDLLEILVEDDGGTDSTADIVKEYEEKYPDSIHLIHKENGGYGSTINNSIKLATGKYFKQLDGDDWYDTENLSKLINEIKDIDVDIIYTSMYLFFEKTGSSILEQGFENVQGKYFINDIISKLKIPCLKMHNLAFKTKLLKENNITLLENCFYTDTEYAMYPFFYAKNIYISNDPIYYHRIGVEGQSVSLEGRRKHLEDRLRVDDEFFKYLNLINDLDANTKEYIINFGVNQLSTGITNYLMANKPSKNNYEKLKEREKTIKKENYDLYIKMEEKNRALKLLRKSRYLLYVPLCYYKIYNLR